MRVRPPPPGDGTRTSDRDGAGGFPRRTLADWLERRGDELGQQYAARDAGDPPLTFVPTGLPRLDARGFLEKGVLTVFMGHPGDGKTCLSLQLLEGAATAGLEAQGYFTEDPARMVSDRVFAKTMGESAFSLRRLTIAEDAAAVTARLAAVQTEVHGWASKVLMDDVYHPPGELLEAINDRWTDGTKLVVVDYAQAFTPESDEGMERMLAGLCWDLNQFAKRRDAAVVLMSQVGRQVIERGRRMFEQWRYRNPGAEPEPQMVEGFRPGPGDIQWMTTAAQQRCRSMGSIFRPGFWMQVVGATAVDNTMEICAVKGNYSGADPSKVVTLGFDGATGRIMNQPGGRSAGRSNRE